MRFRVVLTVIICLLIGIGVYVFRSRNKPTCDRCNIIVIVADSLRADALPCFGYLVNTAPNLCAFAERNIRIPNTYANSTWTRPSNMSILTSLYPVSHGLTDPLPTHMNPKVVTLSQMLYRKGYETTFVSNDQPNMTIELGFGRGFQHISLTDATLTDTAFDSWLTAIDSIKESNAKHTPAFIYFHTDQVHDYIEQINNPPSVFPLDPGYKPSLTFPTTFTDAMWNRALDYLTHSIQVNWGADTLEEMTYYRSLLERPKTVEEAGRVFRSLPKMLQDDVLRHTSQEYYMAKEFPEFSDLTRHLYDENIRLLDARLDTLFNRLRTDGLENNTVVVITSDHGQMLGEHGLIGHIEGIDDKELHIPLILRIPGLAARTFTGLVQHIDIVPTVLEITGNPVPKNIAGISIARSLVGNPMGARNTFVISETELPKKQKSIQSTRWRLVETIENKKQTYDLYDLSRDPLQLTSVTRNNPGIVARLSFVLHRALGNQPVFRTYESSFPDWLNWEERTKRIRDGYYFDPLHG